MAPSFHFKAVTIVCTDRWKSEGFYQKVLGAEIVEGDITCRWYRLGNLALTLVPNACDHTTAEFGEDALTMLLLEVDDLAAAEQHFAENDVEVLQPSDGEMMIILDPDDLPIEIWQRAAT